MKISRSLSAILFFLPLVVGVQNKHSDSLFTDLTFGAGGGSYAGRYYTRHYTPGFGCDGGDWQYVEHRKKVGFQDAGFGIETQLSKTFRLGLRTGYISDKRVKYVGDEGSSLKLKSNKSYIFNPHVSLEKRAVGLGIGALFASDGIYYPSSEPKHYADNKYIKKSLLSYHVRLGDPEKVYCSFSHLENIPLISGGGYVNYGLGTEAIPRVSLWAGGSGEYPFDEASLLLKVGVDISPRWSVHSAYRSGKTTGEHNAGITEEVFSVRLNYRFFRK